MFNCKALGLGHDELKIFIRVKNKSNQTLKRKCMNDTKLICWINHPPFELTAQYQFENKTRNGPHIQDVYPGRV